jgi:hypothetical protein
MLERRAASCSGATGFLKGLAESQWMTLEGIPFRGAVHPSSFHERSRALN